MKKYNLAVCGGTFDHLHKGHREFLRYALSLSRKLLIGLTTERHIKAKNSGYGTESYKSRKQQLEKFLHEENAIHRVLIEPIDDIFIPKIWEFLPIEAIIVSKDSILGAKKINLRRKEQGNYPLMVEVYSLVISQDNEDISSSKIRKGEINREGIPYVKLIWFKRKLLITEKLRRRLKKPFGTLFRKAEDLKRPICPYLITVGDITTKTFNDLGLNQDISVVDFKVARKRKFSSLTELGFLGREKIIKINNPAGCLTASLFKAVLRAFKLKKDNQRIIIQIEGEEDLSVLPLTLGSPLGSVIFYGQPGEGVVKVEVSEKSKEMVFRLVSQFKESVYH